jgi:hypothetical protein
LGEAPLPSPYRFLSAPSSEPAAPHLLAPPWAAMQHCPTAPAREAASPGPPSLHTTGHARGRDSKKPSPF